MGNFLLLKGKCNFKSYCVSKERALQTLNFDTNVIKIDGELRKLWTIEYFNIGGMGATILNI